MTHLLRNLPGLGLCFGLALVATVLWRVGGQPALASPMMLALAGGVGLRAAGVQGAWMRPGAAVALRPVLRTGIVLLGFRLTLGDLGALGVWGVVLIAGVVAVTFMAVRGMGRVLGVRQGLSTLIAAGTSVCGASAVLGVNTVVRARDEDVAYAIACVTVFGTLAMVLDPVLLPLLGFDDQTYGLWVGASLHEVAQAVGAGMAHSDTAAEAATIAKLTRVALLAPLIVFVGLGQGGPRQGVPLFVLGFLGAVVVNTVVPVPAWVAQAISGVSGLCLATALAAMGLETSLAHLRREGLRPLLLGAFGWVVITVLAGGAAWTLAQ